ncbi:CHASE3 domain-containing protein [Paenibacillus hodogayensis]|uniref:histidine kinase n=1 Tax=Paenibacillus hodogayensis TaxID=279208 RepID=A0ABV5W6A8_9BACL
MKSTTSFSIRTKIMLGYLASIVCFIVSLIFVDNQLTRMQLERNYIIDHDIAVHDLTNRIEKHLLDMETGQRGFTITGDEEYLEPYNKGKQQWEQDYLQLFNLIQDNPAQQNNLKAIKATIEHWIRVAGDVAITLKKENRNEAIAQFYKKDPGKADMDQMRTQFEAFRKTEVDLTSQRAAQMNDRNATLRITLYAILAAVALLSTALATMISGTIVRTIKQVVLTISEIAASGGSAGQRIEVRTRDEIGALATVTNQLLESHEQRNWLKTRLAEVVGMYQGEEDIRALGQSFLSRMAPLLDASYGVFYVRKGRAGQQQLVRTASYAASGEIGDADSAVSFRLGEGLVGQCAAENRPIHLEQVPGDYIKVVSGLGSGAPTSIMISPVEYEGKVIAVIEWATLGAFTPLQRQLLDEALEALGTAVNSVDSRMEIERLLRESQAMTEQLQTQTEELQTQAEELQTQQEELRVSNEQLEEQNRHSEQKSRELELIRVELEEYTEQLEQSSQYKSNFLANMSHELRTPLNSMLILSQLLSENTNLTEDEKQYAQVIHSAGNDLLNLINDILDLSKVEAGKIDIIAEEMSVTELPTIMKYQFERLAEQKGIEFVIRLDPDAPAIFWTDERRLHQILRNLLSNAFKFTESGSVTLAVGVADPQKIGVQLPVEGSFVLAISVADTGIGIPANKQEAIFEAFQQADGTTSRKYGGTGLGLSICREFARLLGGSIVVSSKEGAGSTFTLYLPSINQSQTLELLKASEEVAADVSTGGLGMPLAERGEPQRSSRSVVPETVDKEIYAGKRVLVVDDDTRNTFALKSMLEEAGVDVSVAGNGQECLDLLDTEERFDLVLMDIMMPVLDGYAAMRQIRTMPRFETLPIIALTAKAMKFDREKCLEAGASDYISKPLNMHQLFSLMRVWLTKV